jgi:hypothetical protein
MSNEVKVECSSCGASGVYRGFAEPQGVGVVCLNCNGTGCQTINYKPFTGLKRRTGIQTVQLSRGSFIVTGVGPAGNAISYEDFFRGKRP